MPDRACARWLSRLLPSSCREDLFEPSWNDLRIARRDSGPRALLLLLQCWLAILAETLRTPHHSPPKERTAMTLYLIRHAFRMLAREPGFTCAAVLTLALGVGANLALFAVVDAALLRPFAYPDAGRLMILNHRDRRTGIAKEFVAIGDYVDLAQRQTTFQALSAYGGVQGTILGLGEPFRAAGLLAGPHLFETLGVHPTLGRALRPEDSRPGAPPVMMLGYEFWQSRFGSDSSIVGRGIRIDDREFQVVGVGPPAFRFPPDRRTDVIVPETIPLSAPAVRKSGWTFAVARLKPGTALRDAAADLASISRQLEREYPRTNQGSEYFALPLRDALVGNTRPALLLLLAAVGIVLLIACVNVANLLLARALSRRREMALRVALGAGRWRLVAQLLTESLALASVAGVAGIAIARWGSLALVSLVPKSVNVPGIADVRINGAVLAFALGITLLTALVFGVVSTLALRTEAASGALVASGRASMGTGARRGASALVVMEIAFAIMLLIGAGLILRSFSRLLSVDPGFRGERVMTLEVQAPAGRYREPAARHALFERLFAALKAAADVEEAGAAVVVPLTGNNWTVGLERPEHPVPAGERPPEVGWQVASGGYFRALQIPLLAGRLFDQRDGPAGKPVVIVSEAVERQYFLPDRALGREIKLGKQRYEIVGVVGNIKRAGLRDEPRADLYFSFESEPSEQVTFFVRTASDPLRSLPLMKDNLRAAEPGLTLSASRTMEEIAGESIEITRLALWLLAIFAAVALALAGVGIYSVMSCIVRQRAREIGTRVALGATRGDIAWLVMRQGAGIAACGIAIGVAAGLAAARAVASILYGISASDPATLASAAAILAATTMAACYLPARRAARVDPARTLAEP